VASAKTEEDLLMLAQHATAAQLERLVRTYRGIAVSEIAEQNRSYRERELVWFWDEDGSLVIHGRLPAEDGALLFRALEAGRDELRAAHRDARRRGPETEVTENSLRRRRTNDGTDARAETPPRNSADGASNDAGDGLPVARGAGKVSGETHTPRHVAADADVSAETRAPTSLAPDAGVSAETRAPTSLASDVDVSAETRAPRSLGPDADVSAEGPAPGRPSPDPIRLAVATLATTAGSHGDRVSGDAQPKAACDVDEGDVDGERAAVASNADALVLMAETLLASGARTRNAAERLQVVVHVDTATLVDGDPAGRSELVDGPALPAETARRLACDADLVTIIERQGRPLSIGRKTRTISPPLRRALGSRDGGCQFPGCDRRRFVDAHHLQHWASGGETKLSNLVLLCRHHHRLLHEHGYRAERSGDRVVFRRPDGNALAQAPHSGGGDRRELIARNQRRGVEIGPDTPIARSGGERIDYDLAVGGLLHEEGLVDPRDFADVPPWEAGSAA